MQYRKFGTTPLEVSQIGLGCMSMSGAYGSADDAESIRTLHRAFDLGVNFIDTSANYGSGHNQELIRKALAGRRERVIIHSKSGTPRNREPGTPTGGSPEFLTRVCEESLRRLGIETLDIFCLSRVDATVPIEESVGAMARLIEQGKTRYIALSEAGPDSIRRANKVHPIASLQMAYSLYEREAENGNLQACQEFGMGFMAYSVLGRGFLAGLFHELADLPEDDGRRNSPRFQAEQIERNRRIQTAVEAIATEKAATPAQIAIAWAMAQSDFIVPIPGCKSVSHLEDDLAAIDLQLDATDLAKLDALSPPNSEAGPREQLAGAPA